MTDRDSKEYKESSVNSQRRRVVAGLGAIAVSGWMPSRLAAQSVREAEILIIGGGMSGCSTALHLAQLGRDVTLLERGEIASQASGQNAGGLGGTGWGNVPNLLSYLTAGSMGAKSFIVRGKGNPESFHSCSHGAGRVMSRTEARKRFSLSDHEAATEGVECRKDKGVLDETPGAYKSIEAVMAAQSDLVEVVHTLRQVVCVKG